MTSVAIGQGVGVEPARRNLVRLAVDDLDCARTLLLDLVVVRNAFDQLPAVQGHRRAKFRSPEQKAAGQKKLRTYGHIRGTGHPQLDLRIDVVRISCGEVELGQGLAVCIVCDARCGHCLVTVGPVGTRNVADHHFALQALHAIDAHCAMRVRHVEPVAARGRQILLPLVLPTAGQCERVAVGAGVDHIARVVVGLPIDQVGDVDSGLRVFGRAAIRVGTGQHVVCVEVVRGVCGIHLTKRQADESSDHASHAADASREMFHDAKPLRMSRLSRPAVAVKAATMPRMTKALATPSTAAGDTANSSSTGLTRPGGGGKWNCAWLSAVISSTAHTMPATPPSRPSNAVSLTNTKRTTLAGTPSARSVEIS